jgi:hypothetical protein
MDNHKNDATAILEAGRQIAQPLTIGERPFVLAKTDDKLIPVTDAWGRPTRIKRAEVFNDPGSWANYVQRFNRPSPPFTQATLTQGHTEIVIESVIDYHDDAGTPNWCEHVATLRLAQPAARKEWDAVIDKPITQAQLASLLRSAWKRGELINPSGADAVELAQRIEVDQNVKFDGATRLQTGDRAITFVTKTSAKGNIPVPEEITIIYPFMRFGPEIRFITVTLLLDFELLGDKGLAFTLRWPTRENDTDAAARGIIKQLEGYIAPNTIAI